MVPVKAIDRQRLRKNFSVHAEEYDTYAAVQKRVVDYLGRELTRLGAPDGPILDIGTGTGALAAAIQEIHPNQPLLVMDIAHGMTLHARQRLADVVACDADARCLPFIENSYAMVVSSSVYQWLDCLSTAFAEVARILRPGGVFAVSLFGEQTLYELRNAHRAAVAAYGLRRPSHVQNFPTRSEVANALTAAGLSSRMLMSRMEVEYHLDVPELLRQLKHIGASNAASDRPRGLASRKVMQTMITLYEERHRGALGLPASYEVITAIAGKAGTSDCG